MAMLLSILSDLQDASPTVLIAAGAALFLLAILILVIALARARKKRGAAEPAAGDWGTPAAEPAAAEASADWPEPEQAWPEPEGAAPEPAAPEAYAPPPRPAAATEATHYCRCPSCQTQFSVSGVRPIVTNCPGCGRKGFLR